jgi:glucose/arabinose dehydrogenase
MKSLVLFLSLSLAIASSAPAASLPGFRLQHTADLEDFPTSIAIDSTNRIYYTGRNGSIYRLDGAASTVVATLPTRGEGNSGLLGMALLDDDTAVVHYTTPAITYDVLSSVDLTTGEETILRDFACDIGFPARGVSSEHHGGNPTVAADGSIYVGIGEYGGRVIAQDAEWNGGKVFRLAPDGTVTQYALGLRNPFDLAWDAARNRLIISDNGPDAGDEIHIISEGENLGWPWTWGHQPAISGAVAPHYVFPETVAPTGMALMSGRSNVFTHGFLLGAFSTRALYYFPDLDARPMPAPITIIEDGPGFVIDVAEDANGNVYIATGSYTGPSAIYRLVPPSRGDCNGDGFRSSADLDALNSELGETASQRAIDAQDGSHRGSWGCDANGDGVITASDGTEITRLLSLRGRAAGRR